MSEAIKPTLGDVVILTPQDLAALASTGLTPRQLVEQRDALVERVKELEEALTAVREYGSMTGDEWVFEKVDAALSKSLPNTVAETQP